MITEIITICHSGLSVFGKNNATILKFMGVYEFDLDGTTTNQTIKCHAFGNFADNILPFIKPGKKICITGDDLHVKIWRTKQGHARHTLNTNIRTVSFYSENGHREYFSSYT